MPWTALNNVDVDHCLSIDEIGKLLVTLTQESIDVEGGSPVSNELEIETRIDLGEDAAELDVKQLGKISEFTCPEYHGSFVKITNEKLQRFRCHTGHAFSNASLLAELTESVEVSLWNSMRAIRVASEITK